MYNLIYTFWNAYFIVYNMQGKRSEQEKSADKSF